MTTLRRVVLPLLKPALVAALVYSFVRSMTTVSAVIFLVTAQYELATTYIIGRVGNGDYGVALAYCTVLMVLMSVITWGIQKLVGERQLGRRASVVSSASAPVQRRSAPPAAPVTRAGTANGQRPNVVRLSRAEAETARDLGMSEQEYARNKQLLQKEGRL